MKRNQHRTTSQDVNNSCAIRRYSDIMGNFKTIGLCGYVNSTQRLICDGNNKSKLNRQINPKSRDPNHFTQINSTPKTNDATPPKVDIANFHTHGLTF
ncbi:hypothetical protein TNCV_1335381 [Trichonephila clavipes]|nr:hypothetical protein TNCV_1335381 [Trichonephila clavipes]